MCLAVCWPESVIQNCLLPLEAAAGNTSSYPSAPASVRKPPLPKSASLLGRFAFTECYPPVYCQQITWNVLPWGKSPWADAGCLKSWNNSLPPHLCAAWSSWPWFGNGVLGVWVAWRWQCRAAHSCACEELCRRCHFLASSHCVLLSFCSRQPGLLCPLTRCCPTRRFRPASGPSPSPRAPPLGWTAWDAGGRCEHPMVSLPGPPCVGAPFSETGVESSVGLCAVKPRCPFDWAPLHCLWAGALFPWEWGGLISGSANAGMGASSALRGSVSSRWPPLRSLLPSCLYT